VSGSNYRSRPLQRRWTTTCAIVWAALSSCHSSGATPPDASAAVVDAAAAPTWSLRTSLVGVDLSTVWGAGAEIFSAGAGAMIAHSDDGGASFRLISTGVDGQPRFRAISGSGTTDVWLVGGDGNGGALALHSSDHGASWQPRTLPDPTTGVAAAWAIDAQRVLLATEDGRLLRAPDGGTTWSSVFRGVKVNSFWGAPDGTIYGVGGAPTGVFDGGGDPSVDVGCDAGRDASVGASGDRGIVLRSADAGVTWASMGVSTPGPLLGVWGRPDGGTVLAAGMNTSVAVTSDAGEHWLERGQPADVPDLDFTNVWVGPGDGALFFASPSGVVRGVGFDCRGAVQLTYETVPAAADGSRAVAAVWGLTSDDVWAVGPGGAIRERR
jgi:hypothetical protein